MKTLHESIRTTMDALNKIDETKLDEIAFFTSNAIELENKLTKGMDIIRDSDRYEHDSRYVTTKMINLCLNTIRGFLNFTKMVDILRVLRTILQTDNEILCWKDAVSWFRINKWFTKDELETLNNINPYHYDYKG